LGEERGGRVVAEKLGWGGGKKAKKAKHYRPLEEPKAIKRHPAKEGELPYPITPGAPMLVGKFEPGSSHYQREGNGRHSNRGVHETLEVGPEKV